jgi:BirA family transcriptional regulator, biotin operon repressor / biotin---[acetyl-CoA-carboxylase] ligase
LPPELAEALARATSRLVRFNPDVRWYAEASSTNDIAAAVAEQGGAEGSVVIADAQAAGRGRHGRTWSSPAGGGLYVSVVLRPHEHAMQLLTIAAGVALVEGIQAATGLATALKWPNDVMIPAAVRGRDAKLAGILAEGGPSHVVLGFGINVSPAPYPADVAARATSLERELGRRVDRGALLIECLVALAARYDDVQRSHASGVLDAWRAHARPMLGRAVEWDARDGVRQGVAEGVDGSGALLVRSGDGTVRVISGEVRWI